MFMLYLDQQAQGFISEETEEKCADTNQRQLPEGDAAWGDTKRIIQPC